MDYFIAAQLDDNTVYMKCLYKELTTLSSHAYSKEGATKLKSKTFKNIIIDATNIEEINSTGIGYLIELYGLIKSKKGFMIIILENNNIYSLLEQYRLTELINIVKTKDEAFAYYENIL